jgi:hypothetical protein
MLEIFDKKGKIMDETLYIQGLSYVNKVYTLWTETEFFSTSQSVRGRAIKESDLEKLLDQHNGLVGALNGTLPLLVSKGYTIKYLANGRSAYAKDV